jgi:uroporphyrinogen-III decarboxylase
MKDYTLRNHIPIAGTGNREPCTGNESSFRATLGFTPRWYYDRLGVDFSERWHKDADYRYETLTAMREYLFELFPTIEAFQPKVEDGIDYTCATLSGVEGAMIIAEAYGQQVVYSKDNWPLVSSTHKYSKEYLESLPPFDPENNEAFIKLMEQMDYMENKWGKIAGYLNFYQGILNTAFRLRGQDIFMDMYDDPDFVFKLFDHIYDTTLKIAKIVQERQRKSGFYIDQFSSANCVVNMISPDLYEKFVLPYDIKFSQEFPRYGIHTCNWNVTPYLEPMRKIDRMGYLDMGIDSDLEKVRNMFPDARRGVLYSPAKIEQAPLEEIRKDFERIHRELGPCDIILADIETTVPNEKIQLVVDIANTIANNA